MQVADVMEAIIAAAFVAYNEVMQGVKNSLAVCLKLGIDLNDIRHWSDFSAGALSYFSQFESAHEVSKIIGYSPSNSNLLGVAFVRYFIFFIGLVDFPVSFRVRGLLKHGNLLGTRSWIFVCSYSGS